MKTRDQLVKAVEEQITAWLEANKEVQEAKKVLREAKKGIEEAYKAVDKNGLIM